MESTKLTTTVPCCSGLISERRRMSNPYLQINCFICGQYIVHACTTECNHSFCEVCLEQYMIFLDQCPVCLTPTRHRNIFSNRALDQLIEDYIKKFEGALLPAYQARRQISKLYKVNRRFQRGNCRLDTGSVLDVRDSNYVWGRGKITAYFYKEYSLVFTVKYEQRTLTEDISVFSERLAPLGFFSNRQDLPRIRRNRWLWQGSQVDKVYTLQEGINIPRKIKA